MIIIKIDCKDVKEIYEEKKAENGFQFFSKKTIEGIFLRLIGCQKRINDLDEFYKNLLNHIEINFLKKDFDFKNNTMIMKKARITDHPSNLGGVVKKTWFSDPENELFKLISAFLKFGEKQKNFNFLLNKKIDEILKDKEIMNFASKDEMFFKKLEEKLITKEISLKKIKGKEVENDKKILDKDFFYNFILKIKEQEEKIKQNDFFNKKKIKSWFKQEKEIKNNKANEITKVEIEGISYPQLILFLIREYCFYKNDFSILNPDSASIPGLSLNSGFTEKDMYPIYLKYNGNSNAGPLQLKEYNSEIEIKIIANDKEIEKQIKKMIDLYNYKNIPIGHGFGKVIEVNLGE